MNRRESTPAERAQHAAELVVRRDYEATTPAQRLARSEALDPSQTRPSKVPCIGGQVDFMAWDTYADLGVYPLRPSRYLEFN